MDEWLSWFSHKHLKNSLLHVFLILLTLLTTQMAMSRISAAKWTTNLRVYWLPIISLHPFLSEESRPSTLTHWQGFTKQDRHQGSRNHVDPVFHGRVEVGTISIETVRFIWVNLTFAKLNSVQYWRRLCATPPQTLWIPRSKSWNLSILNMTNCEQIGNLVFFSFWVSSPNPLYEWLPSRKLTYPTWGKGKSSSKWTFQGIC